MYDMTRETVKTVVYEDGKATLLISDVLNGIYYLSSFILKASFLSDVLSTLL